MSETRLNKRTRGQGRTQDFPRLLGGPPCLLFANTVEAPISDHPLEFLGSHADLARWAWHAGLLEEAETERLRAAAERDPKAAATTFRRAMALRDAIDRLFRAVVRSATPDERDLGRVREEYAAAVAHARLLPAGDSYAWSWEGRPDDLGRPLWPVARSAVDLLTEGDLRRVKECPGAGDCGWLFYDTSRNAARRWCSMEGCGSRVKMRRHYARHRATPDRTSHPEKRP
jgi:predicted RNA-binding Zn ribbon-like protein